MRYDYDRRSRIAVRWDNQANGAAYSLRWNKTKWQLEETVDGSPIPTLRSQGEGPPMAVYEMRMLGNLLSRFDTPVSPSPIELLREGHFHVDARGAEVRTALIAGCLEYMKRAEREMRQDHYEARADVLRWAIEKVTPKLKWKKVG